jgi:hypothetical protein
MDNYYNLRRIAIKYNLKNITHFILSNKLEDDKFIQITNNNFITNNNYIIDHYTNINKTKNIIFILSQDKKDYMINYYNNHDEIILYDVLLENECFINNIIDILRLNKFKKILYNPVGTDLSFKKDKSLVQISTSSKGLFYKYNFRYINNLDNERLEYNINKLNNLKIKDIKLDIIIKMIDELYIKIINEDELNKIKDYYNDNLDKNICELFIYMNSNHSEIFNDIYNEIYDNIGLYKIRSSLMYLDL